MSRLAWLLWLSLAGGEPAKTVDFSIPPRQGLTLRVERSVTWEHVSGERSVPLHLPESVRLRDSFEHEFLRVADGRVTSVLRRYAEVASDTTPPGVRPPSTGPLAGRVVRVTGGGERPRVEVEQAGRWSVPGRLRHAIHAGEFLRPLIDLGDRQRRVGERWKIDAVALAFGVLGRALPSGPGNASATLVSINDGTVDRPGPRAILRVSLWGHSEASAVHAVISDKLSWNGTAVYDLAHRVVVRCSGEGSVGTRIGGVGANRGVWHENTRSLKTSARAHVIEK